MADEPIRSTWDVLQGAVSTRSVTFSSGMVAAFGNLIDDHAPVHFDENFAKAGGFSGCIVHGLLLSSVFSGMLGEQLPGPNSVINTLTIKVHRPALIGETLQYQVAVEQVSEAVGAVVLNLSAKNSNGEPVLSGKATCSFPRRASLP